MSLLHSQHTVRLLQMSREASAKAKAQNQLTTNQEQRRRVQLRRSETREEKNIFGEKRNQEIMS